MVKAYLTWISTFYEGEDIEIRYSIFKDQDLIREKSFFANYTKPALCGLVATERLLRDLEKHLEEEIVIVINDGSLFALLENTSGTNKAGVQSLARRVRKKLETFHNIQIENVTGDHLAIQEWNSILTPESLI